MDKSIFVCRYIPPLFSALSEPPLCMGVVVPLALREAIVSARADGGIPPNEWFQIGKVISLPTNI